MLTNFLYCAVTVQCTLQKPNYICKVVISMFVCLFGRSILTQEPLDRFVTNFDLGARGPTVMFLAWL